MRYNNYHKHTHYSNLRTLDCVSKPIDYILRAKELGHDTYFTTEHGSFGNVHEAFTLCQEHGLKCVYAVEAYYVDDRNDRSTRSNYHIILVALTEKARKEINKILSIANTDGYYYKPRIDRELLLSLTPTDTVITTACVGGRMFKDGYENEFLIPVHNHFKDNFYLEVQPHCHEVQINYNAKILEVSKKYSIKIIHANDSHYIMKEDSKYRDLFLKAKGMIYEDEEGFILDYPTYDEIVDRYTKQGVLSYSEIQEALNSTLCLDNSEGVYFDKEFKIPKVVDGDSDKYLSKVIKDSWKIEKANVKEELHKTYCREITNEYNTVKNCGMSDYFILDNMIIKKAVEEYGAVLTRSGRGSAVSFYINKLLGLTEVDRIKSPITLYPSRFMTTERILESKSLPDIDLNFASVEPVIKASKDILGEDGIYYMVAYKPLQDSSAFRLWCKANDMDINDYNEIAKNIEGYAHDKHWGKIIEESKVFKGVIESIAPSPCSFLLMDKPISEEIGLIKVGDEICCCLDGYNCDVYKYLKNDYLTVKVWELIDSTYKLIGRDIDDISFIVNNSGDNVWDLYKYGITTTLNQADSDFGKQISTKYAPRNLSELSAYVAALRPGFASLLNNFVDRKEYTTGVKELDDILDDSFNYLIYQESIMKYLVWLGIKEKGTYDIIKKIAKKKFKDKELEDLKSKLLKGWIKQVGREEGFNETWQVVEDAARYSFNASHSLSVAIDSLYGAYLKANYPLEYYSVALNLYIGDIAHTDNLVEELKYFDIKISSPKFRYSKGEYFFDKKDNVIYKGIGSIKFLNSTIGDELYSLKDNVYSGFIELLKDIKDKTACNSKQLDLLIKIGFFSEFGTIKKLLSIVEIYNKLNGKKSISKTKVDELGLTGVNLLEYGTETAKMYKLEYTDRLISYMASNIDDEELSISDVLRYQRDILGYIDYKNPELDKKLVMVYWLDDKYATKKCKLYCLNNGSIVDFKVSKNVFDNKEFAFGDVLYADAMTRKPKTRCVIDEKGKKHYEKDNSVLEWWLESYTIQNNKL